MAVILSIALQGGSFAAQTEGKASASRHPSNSTAMFWRSTLRQQLCSTATEMIRPTAKGSYVWTSAKRLWRKKRSCRETLKKASWSSDCSPPTEMIGMPPPDSHKKLTTEAEGDPRSVGSQRALKYQKHWSFESPNRTALPQVKDPELGSQSDRPLCARHVGEERNQTCAGGGSRYPRTASVARHNRTTADTRRGPTVCGRTKRRMPTTGSSRNS